jgi:hypothetical protein
MPRKQKAAPSEVFVSHSSKNAIFIERLRDVLARHGVNSFVSKTNIRGAQQWHDEIGTALRRCDWFLLVLSPEPVRSTWVKHELIYALQGESIQGTHYSGPLQELRQRGAIVDSIGHRMDRFPKRLQWSV